MKRIYALCSVLCALFATALPLQAGASRPRSIIQDTEVQSIVQELVEPLARAAGMPAGRLRIHIVRDDNFNAFVMAGEDIYIYTGLIASVESPLAFQAVIAHELGHMMGGHIAQLSARIRSETVRSMIIQALGVGMMVAGGNPSAGMGVVAGGQGVARAGILAFSRDEERLADNHAIDIMVGAGLDPNGLVMILQQMNDMHGAAESMTSQYRVAHPFTSERLQHARERIAQMETRRWPPTDKELQERFNLARAKVVGYLAPLERIATIYPSRDTSNPAIYARAIASMRAGNLADARLGALTLIGRAPANPFFYEFLGDIEYRFGNYDDSIRAYDKSLELRRDSPHIQTALALVLSERRKPGDADRAVEMAKRSLIAYPSPLAYWVLARAENIRGNKGVADWAMAEFYNMNRNAARAREFARRARANLPKDSPEYIKAGELL